MSIFPFINTGSISQTTTAITKPREYAWDYENNDFLIVDGKLQIVEGLEAIKVWIYMALNTQRYRYLAYGWSYGHELENLIGNNNISKQVLESEAKRYVEEALKVNGNITSIKDFTVTTEDEAISLKFTAVTTYGEVEVNV